MSTIKKEALRVIASLPESANLDDIMYKLYVIDQIQKGRKAIAKGKVFSTERLKKEISAW